MQLNKIDIVKKIIWLRLAQILVNQRYKKGDFLVPIHLAMGHETIATAVTLAMREKDGLFLTHRNIHYNLAKMNSLKEELDEYYLRESGLANGQLGSMNLFNPDKNIYYSSSILGNNLPVGCGFALGNKMKNQNGVVFITTGDGAVEEGSFYESLLFLKSNYLSSVVIIENNGWSLGTRIRERRANIDFSKLADSLAIEYLLLEGNDPFEYLEKLNVNRSKALKNHSPILIEVKVTTLGYWFMESEDHPNGKFINYHAGPAPKVDDKDFPQLVSSNEDPLFLLTNYLSLEELTNISNDQRIKLKDNIS
jgi:pyruvate dehydrogenase E1 component alpha subunit